MSAFNVQTNVQTVCFTKIHFWTINLSIVWHVNMLKVYSCSTIQSSQQGFQCRSFRYRFIIFNLFSLFKRNKEFYAQFYSLLFIVFINIRLQIVFIFHELSLSRIVGSSMVMLIHFHTKKKNKEEKCIQNIEGRSLNKVVVQFLLMFTWSFTCKTRNV